MKNVKVVLLILVISIISVGLIGCKKKSGSDSKKTSEKEVSEKKVSDKEVTDKDVTPKEMPEKETSEDETPRKDEPEKETPDVEVPEKENNDKAPEEVKEFDKHDLNKDGFVDINDDINKDGIIDALDEKYFSRLENFDWQIIGDLNEDGVIDVLDGICYLDILDELEEAEKASKPEPTKAPEPTKETEPTNTPSPKPAPVKERKKVADVEGEVLRIRKIYNEIEDRKSNKYYTVKSVKSGVKEFLDPYSNEVICIEINKGIDDINYSRYYYFNEKELMFVYLESSDSHRIYFKDGYMFRWRYAPDSRNYDKSIYHDNEASDEFYRWENIVATEANKYVNIFIP